MAKKKLVPGAKKFAALLPCGYFVHYLILTLVAYKMVF